MSRRHIVWNAEIQRSIGERFCEAPLLGHWGATIKFE